MMAVARRGREVACYKLIKDDATLTRKSSVKENFGEQEIRSGWLASHVNNVESRFDVKIGQKEET